MLSPTLASKRDGWLVSGFSTAQMEVRAGRRPSLRSRAAIRRTSVLLASHLGSRTQHLMHCGRCKAKRVAHCTSLHVISMLAGCQHHGVMQF